jgi:hypothetical protein
MSAVLGAIIGFLIGAGLSYYVVRLDHQKVELGVRSRPQYRLSIFGVPIIFAIVGPHRRRDRPLNGRHARGCVDAPRTTAGRRRVLSARAHALPALRH